MTAQTSKDIRLANGGILRVQVLTPQTFRIRLRQDDRFPEPSMIRYGILRSDWPEVDVTIGESETTVTFQTAAASLAVDKADGQATLRDAEGQVLTQDMTPPWSDAERGFGAEFSLADGERLYGLGDVTRERIQKRGYKTIMWVRNVASYVPIPYVMSSRGWALFLNTTWRHYFDLGATQPDRLRFFGQQGELDYYLFVGSDYPALLNLYTDVAGKPHLLPQWGYALTFVCNQQANAREMLDDCLNFRREDIPCDLVGLEPGWMEKHYDFSTEKKWHPERFYLPHWAPKGPQTFLGAAERLGFKMSLWLCCDYDLTFEEERRAGAAGHPPAQIAPPHPDDFEQDKHFRERRMDPITKPEEPWFEHLKQFVDQGVSAFKLDGANQVLAHPDRKWGNGMDDEEMHNLFPTVLNKQMHLGFKEQTGRRPMVYSSGGYAGIQQYSATWAGDTGGEAKPLTSMLNHGLSGHVNTSCDMHVFSAEGIHFGFLQSWSQVCSWAYWRHPWLLGDKLLPIFKHYADLRYKLLPYLYSTAHEASHTGMPIMRAMPLVAPNDPRSDELLMQYMLGDAFLVAAFTNQVHLPEGEWIDYWTGQRYQGPQDVTCNLPEDRGGPLFVRAGAIIPMGPVMDYVGQKPVDRLSLHVYPQGESRFTLYEDDGISFAYQQGEVARTESVCSADGQQVKLTISPRQGEYEGMPAGRSYDVYLYVGTAPTQVSVNGAARERGCGPQNWEYDADSGAVHLWVAEDAGRSEAVIIRCEG